MSKHYFISFFLVIPMFSSCASPKNRTPVKEGCYYYGNKAIFKIINDRGTLKIPGDIKTFQVTAYGNDAAAEVNFSPSFILNNDPTSSALINMKFDNGRTRSQTQTVSAVSTNPSFKINWAAYGETSLHLGGPC